jgi:hypothetical protein
MTGASAKARGALEVILFEESRFRGSLMFTSAEVTVGSDPGVMVRLNDADLSPCHAVLFFDGETCTLENYDEVNGTQVNGVSVARQELSATDEVQIGRFRLRIAVHRPDATPAPVSPRPPARPAKPAAAPQSRPAPPPVQESPVPATAPAPRPGPPPPPPVPRAPSPPPPSASASRGIFPPPPPPPASRAVPSLPSPSAALSKTVPAGNPPAAPPQPDSSRSASALSDWDNVPTVPTRPEPPTVAKTAVVPAAPAPTALAVAPEWENVPTVPTKPEFEPAPTKPALASVPSPAPSRGRGQKRTSTQVLVTRTAPSAGRSAQKPAVAAPEARSVPPLRSIPLSNADDDDDEEADFQPGFSLFEELRETGILESQRRAVEIVRFRHGCVLKLQHLRRGEKLRLHGMRKPIGRCSGAGEFAFQREAVPESAAVSINGRTIPDAAWRAKADRRGRITLEPATQVIFPLPSGEGVLIHLVPAAGTLPASTWRPRLSRLALTLAGVSVIAHLMVFAILGLASLVRRDYIAENKEGRFARIALKEVELEPPVAPPKQEEKRKKKPKPEPSQTSSTEPAPRLASLHIPRSRTPSKPSEAASSATTQKLLSALGSMSAGPKPMSATAMSNLDAAGPVKGAGFKVSGAIGKLPGDSLRLAAAGSGMGRLDTKSTHDMGKDLGRVLGRAPTGQVRAQVTARPNTMKVEGHLDRGEIQKVINAHIHELQGCYERQLIASPNLSGKVTFEWIISPTGAVSVVKIKSSSLSSNEATSCMQAAIRRWMFPAPSGGQVTVVYPIALANSGT